MTRTRFLTLVSTCLFAVLALTACWGGPPAAVEEAKTSGKLPPCPDSPNCVSSLADSNDAIHYLPPLRYTGTADEAKARLLAVIAAMPRTKVVTDQGNYLHVEFTSALMRYVDDVQFVIDDANRQIDFRSAARIGRGDMGANRGRMEEISTRFNQE
jgi:uncharacterized protein (DUF1499 family)